MAKSNKRRTENKSLPQPAKELKPEEAKRVVGGSTPTGNGGITKTGPNGEQIVDGGTVTIK